MKIRLSKVDNNDLRVFRGNRIGRQDVKVYDTVRIDLVEARDHGDILVGKCQKGRIFM